MHKKESFPILEQFKYAHFSIHRISKRQQSITIEWGRKEVEEESRKKGN